MLLLLLGATDLFEASAQLDSVYAEVYYVDDGTVPGYPCGYTTFRLYAVLSSENYDVKSMTTSDTDGADWLMHAGGDGIWNSSWGGTVGDELNPLFWSFQPSAEYDSYLTIAKASEEDEGSQLVVTGDPTELQDWEDNFGVPEPDFDETGTAIHHGTGMLLFGSSALHAIDPVGSFASNTGPQLLAQVTTNGTFSWRISLVIDGPGIGGITWYFHNTTLPDGTPYSEAYNLEGSIDPQGTCLEDCSLPEDFDEDGIVNVPDVLHLLAQFGTSGGDADLDADGWVLSSDLLLVLAALWLTCD